MWSVFGAW
jgi:hypothetical protein